MEDEGRVEEVDEVGPAERKQERVRWELRKRMNPTLETILTIVAIAVLNFGAIFIASIIAYLLGVKVTYWMFWPVIWFYLTAIISLGIVIYNYKVVSRRGH